jgi:hypothetical protein
MWGALLVAGDEQEDIRCIFLYKLGMRNLPRELNADISTQSWIACFCPQSFMTASRSSWLGLKNGIVLAGTSTRAPWW